MELMNFLLLLLAGWTQQSGTTNCTVYLSSPPYTLNLLCPSAVCRLDISNIRSCIGNDCPSCNIADCNKVYYLCTNVSSESSSQGTSSTGHVTHSNEQPITCTLITTRGLAVTCQKEDYQLTFMSTSTACHGDLGINCDLDDPVPTCIRVYDFCMGPQPNTCPPMGETVHTTVLIQTYTKMYPSPTHSPASETCTPTPIEATGAIVGLLVVLLIVVTTGWVYTCSRRKDLGLRSRTISNATDLNLNNNQAYAIKITHQRDLAYEVTSIGEPQTSQAETDELEPDLEPTYETVQPSSVQTIERSGSQTSEDTNQLEPTYETVQLSSVQMRERPGSQEDEDESTY